MTLKTLGKGRTEVNLALGPNAQVFGTLYTVPVGKSAFIKEILAIIKGSASTGNFDLYVLPNGVVDLTAVATDVSVVNRGKVETKNIDCMLGPTAYDSSVTGAVVTVVGRNTLLEAGDALKCWIHYAAVTPGLTDMFFRVSGDEF